MLWILLAIGSGLFHGLVQIYRRKLVQVESALHVLAGSNLVRFIFVLPFLLLDHDFGLHAPTYVLLVCNAVLMVLSAYFINAAFRREEASSLTPLFNISPVFLLVLSFFILGEVVNPLQFVGIIIIVFGGYYLTTPDLKHLLKPFRTVDRKNVFYILLAMVMWSLSSILVKVILESTSGFFLLFFVVGVELIITLTIAAIKHDILGVFRSVLKDRRIYIPLSMVGLINYFLVVFALGNPSALVALVIPLRRAGSVFTSLIGGKAMHEHNIHHKLIAALIMIIGVFFVAIL